MNQISEESGKFVFEEKNNRWSESLKTQKEKIEDLNLTPSGKVIERLTSDNVSHEELGMEIAEKNLAFFETIIILEKKNLKERLPYQKNSKGRWSQRKALLLKSI